MLYKHLDIYPRRMLLPHRLMPYSYKVLINIHNRTDILPLINNTPPDVTPDLTLPNTNIDLNTPKGTDLKVPKNEWMSQSCCIPRQNCIERDTWLSIKNKNIPIINYYGLFIPLGNSNFLREEYRGCILSDYKHDYCE